MTIASLSPAALDPSVLARWTGSTAFALAAGVCLLAWHMTTRSRASRDGRLWLWLALGYLALLVDAQLDLRFILSRWLETRVGSDGFYAARRPLQLAALLAAAAAAVVLLIGPVRRLGRRHRPLGLALIGASLNGLLLLAEIVSLHSLDALLYARQGPVMPIVPMWLCGAGIVCGSALWVVRSAGRPRRVP